MFTKYLAEQIPIRHLGYFQRINESAVQYAERLLADKVFAGDKKVETIAQHLVNYYKDHNFVIDADEAKNLLGANMVRENTPEYKVADEIFKFLDLISFFLEEKNRKFYWVGAATEEGGHIFPKPAQGVQPTSKTAAQR